VDRGIPASTEHHLTAALVNQSPLSRFIDALLARDWRLQDDFIRLQHEVPGGFTETRKDRYLQVDPAQRVSCIAIFVMPRKRKIVRTSPFPVNDGSQLTKMRGEITF
jgi:hypothetical protein